MPFTSRELLARLIKCEAGGEGDSGMRAVASVVMNRVEVPYGEYFRVNQGSLRNVITQPGQFTCLQETFSNGSYNPQNIYNINPDKVDYDIADWVIGGGSLGAIANSLWYFNPYNPSCPSYFPSDVGLIQNRIQLHCFYIPTQKYAQT